ncbi:MAG: hypothetical protein IAF94_01040 [Pirellulaceae bacterium]|nr:hypothetical protein [Pirellulaceae bacterium]
MTTSEKNMKCNQQEVNNDTLQAGEGNPRGVEKPGGFFSLGGAPIPGLAAEKPGGFFSGPPSGEETRNSLAIVAEEPEELLQRLTAPVPWKRGGRPTVLTPDVRDQVCKLLSVGLSRRQVGAYLNIDPTTITHAAARDEEFARELQRAEELTSVPAMVSLVAASRKNWRAALTLLNRKPNPATMSAEEKKQRHQDRLEQVRRKSEIARLEQRMRVEAAREHIAHCKALDEQEAAERRAKEPAESEPIGRRRRK